MDCNENEHFVLVFMKMTFKAQNWVYKFGHRRCATFNQSPEPEIIDPVFAKTSQNARFLLSENERFGLVFVKTGSINSGTAGSEFLKALISEHGRFYIMFFEKD
jgi:hypothetical protein